jgi:hypothetical protein
VVNGPARVALTVALLLSANKQYSVTPRSDPVESRDSKIFKKYEDQVAQIFESSRRANALPKLSRITHRQKLDQLVCTAALEDANPEGRNRPTHLMYKTPDPASVTLELKSIARYKDLDEPSSNRYAVSIWPGTDKETGQRIYWVGVAIYPSAYYEFIDSNLTDDRFDRNEWKKMVAPHCRNIK